MKWLYLSVMTTFILFIFKYQYIGGFLLDIGCWGVNNVINSWLCPNINYLFNNGRYNGRKWRRVSHLYLLLLNWWNRSWKMWALIWIYKQKVQAPSQRQISAGDNVWRLDRVLKEASVNDSQNFTHSVKTELHSCESFIFHWALRPFDVKTREGNFLSEPVWRIQSESNKRIHELCEPLKIFRKKIIRGDNQTMRSQRGSIGFSLTEWSLFLYWASHFHTLKKKKKKSSWTF